MIGESCTRNNTLVSVDIDDLFPFLPTYKRDSVQERKKNQGPLFQLDPQGTQLRDILVQEGTNKKINWVVIAGVQHPSASQH